MNDLLLRPMPIRKIKNNILRRVAMMFLFPVFWIFAVVINAFWSPFLFLSVVVRLSCTLALSMIEFWNKPEQEN